MAKVTREQIVRAVHAKTGLPKSTIRDAIGDAIDIIVQAVVNDEKVAIKELGTLFRRRRKVRSPSGFGKSTSVVKQAWVVKFVPSKTLRRSVR